MGAETLPNLAEMLRTVSENFHRRRGTLDSCRTVQTSLLPSGFGFATHGGIPSQTQSFGFTHFPRLNDSET